MTEEKTVKKATKITDAELWQLRALDAQEGRLHAEAKLIQTQIAEVQSQMEEFVDSLRNKYGEVKVAPDGKLVYEHPVGPIPGIPGRPDVPDAPQPEEEEDEEE